MTTTRVSAGMKWLAAGLLQSTNESWPLYLWKIWQNHQLWASLINLVLVVAVGCQQSSINGVDCSYVDRCSPERVDFVLVEISLKVELLPPGGLILSGAMWTVTPLQLPCCLLYRATLIVVPRRCVVQVWDHSVTPPGDINLSDATITIRWMCGCLAASNKTLSARKHSCSEENSLCRFVRVNNVILHCTQR